MRFQVVDRATQLDFVDTTREPVFEVLQGLEAEQDGQGRLTAADLEAARDTPLHGLLLDAIENMSVGFILFDHDDRLVLCNSRYREFYVSIAHLLEPGKTYDEIADAVFEFAARSTEPVRTDGWVRGGRSDANRFGLAAGRWLESRGEELDGGGHVALHSDVTRHKDREIELADEIRRLQADRDRAAALVADLELSLSLLRGGAEKLRLEAGGRNGLAALADDLRIAVKRGDEVLLDLAEVTADEHQLIRPVNLNDLLVGLQPLLESTAGQSVESELRIDNRVYDVELDANAFGRLILELAARARDVMTDGGMMVIGSANVSLIGEMAGADGSASGPHVMISLADEGPGLSDAEIAAVLDHPVDDEAAKDENIDPLIAARRFVCQSGGVTRLESTAEDGTTIELYFPRYFPAG